MTRRNTEHLVILPTLAVCLIFGGLKLIPENFAWEISVAAIETWSFGAFIGLILVATGICNLAKAAIFAYKSRGSVGEWHFRLTQDELLWHVPNHAYGPEIGFQTALSNIRELEFRTISEYEKMNEREYWIHLHDRDPIQLHTYTGISVASLVQKIHAAGVPYNETFIEL